MAVITALGVIVGTIYGQTSQKDEPTIEVKGVKNTYIQKEVPGLYGVRNKNNKLRDIDPSYLFFQHIPPITLNNRSLIEEIVQKHLGEYFKQYKGKYDSCTRLGFYLYADIDGNIKEMYMSYPKEIGMIPATVIEALEEDILRSDIKLIFNKDHRVFKGSAWVGLNVGFDPNKIRDCKTE